MIEHLPEAHRLRLSGVAGVEEAEPLLAALMADPALHVDLSGCAHLHAALLQTLMRWRPPMTAPAAGSGAAQLLDAAGLTPPESPENP